MLSRTAENLYWLARFVERAENNARLVDMGNRMTALPGTPEERANEWASVIISAGAGAHYPALFGHATQATVASYILLAPENPSSVYSCLRDARRNARAVRTALTSEIWEAINDSWIAIKDADLYSVTDGALADFVDWVKTRGALFRGSVDSSLLRSDGYDFLRLGTFIERTDSTARLLDVKYHVLLPADYGVGSVIDQYQWLSILRASSSLRNYHRSYDTGVTAWGVADFLTLNPSSPRSLIYCSRSVNDHLQRLKERYHQDHPCYDVAAGMLLDLKRETIESVFQSGLHEFLVDFITKNNILSASIGEAFGFGAGTAGTEDDDDLDDKDI